MKTRKQLFIFLCMGWVFFPVLANTGIASDINNVGTSKKHPINLVGAFQTGGLRSGGDAITAELQDNTISVTFHKQLGDVLITITDSGDNPVYSETVNSSAQQQTFVPLTELSAGAYTITFSNEKGMMYGDFEL